jgi:thiamine pyrophosphate-dependent acetolactate synthase large subunit-like protein
MSGARVDFAAVARAHGARGFVAETVSDLRHALRSIDSEGPTVIDVRIDPAAAFPVNARADEITTFTSR